MTPLRKNVVCMIAATVAVGAVLTACGGSSDKHDELKVPLNNAAGAEVATATFDFEDGYAKVTVETTGSGQISPGFHGLHIHSVGKCEPGSVAPSGGEVGDFNSAGGHFQAPGHTGHPMSGDLSSLQVRKDGSGLLVTTTDGFTRAQLTAGKGTAIILHSGPDNFGNIPADRYRQNSGVPGPDEKTMMTGDAGSRVACGVISAGK
ncbi:MAG: superoxide dismutase family protein [Gordonia sp. (in: high G+C Gram-positive bacteria)]